MGTLLRVFHTPSLQGVTFKDLKILLPGKRSDTSDTHLSSFHMAQLAKEWIFFCCCCCLNIKNPDKTSYTSVFQFVKAPLKSTGSYWECRNECGVNGLL